MGTVGRRRNRAKWIGIGCLVGGLGLVPYGIWNLLAGIIYLLFRAPDRSVMDSIRSFSDIWLMGVSSLLVGVALLLVARNRLNAAGRPGSALAGGLCGAVLLVGAALWGVLWEFDIWCSLLFAIGVVLVLRAIGVYLEYRQRAFKKAV